MARGDGKGEEQREQSGKSTIGEKIAERAASVGNFQDSTSYSQPDFVADYDRFFDIVDDQVAARLRTDGFAVVDGIFGSDWAHAFLDELQWLTKKDLLIENRTQFTNAQGERIIVRKPNIFEVDLHMEIVRTKVPQMDALFRQRHFVRALAAQLPEFGLRDGPNGVTVKLQHNKGCGACFPLHYDNPGRPSNRKLTCLVYLNPDWKKGDGGELKLFPLLHEPVTIEPTFDRCVMFVSDLVLHRVLPSYAPRYCFTIWIDGEVCTLCCNHIADNARLCCAEYVCCRFGRLRPTRWPVALAADATALCAGHQQGRGSGASVAA